MNRLETLVTAFADTGSAGTLKPRATVRRAPACETLEGRQLLNAAWGPPQGLPMLAGIAGTGVGRSAEIFTLGTDGMPKGAHVFRAGEFRRGDFGKVMAGHDFSPPSAQLRADFQTLQSDTQTLLAEIPSNLTSAVKSDRSIIQKAFSSLTPTERKALLPGGPKQVTPGSDPLTNLAADLTSAGVSSDQVNTVVTDIQNLKTALTTTDPTLQAKIAADKAAITNDGGPAFPSNDSGGPIIL
jgi:hypothetical protein